MTLNEKLTSLELKLKEAMERSAKIATLKAEIAALKKLIADEERGESRKSELRVAIVPTQSTKKALSGAQEKRINDNTRQDGRRKSLFSRTLSVLLAVAASVAIGYLWFRAKRPSIRSEHNTYQSQRDSFR
jgi:hypothetical protein